jgi:hypothetical protein
MDFVLVLLILSNFFYGLLCIFSIVTGIMYATGKRKLNPVELSDKFMKKIKDTDSFAKKMGIVTIIVGIFQGLVPVLIINTDIWFYYILIFTIFSICSVGYKLYGKISKFAIIKLSCYLLILIALLCFRFL